MHALARRLHGATGKGATAHVPTAATKGLVLDQGWSYDLMVDVCDVVLFHGQLRAMRLRAADLADVQPGKRVLDVGCGTGTLALEMQRRVGASGRVVGIDPGARQIARARAKAARRKAPIDFEIGVIEQLPFPAQSFDVALSTLMMHHLPANLKRQGLAEIARVLAPHGRLVIADFTRRQDRQGRAARFHAGGSDLGALAELLSDAGFAQVRIEEMPARGLVVIPGAGFVSAIKV